MLKPILTSISLLVVLLTLAGDGAAQDKRFVPVEGSGLKSRVEAATRQGRAAQSRFWAAYSFDVKPGIAVDLEPQEFNGSITINSDIAVITESNLPDTRNLAVFLFYESGGATISRLEVYNLDRQRDYDGYPVYWMGKAPTAESLALLKDLVESKQDSRMANNAVTAVALHEGTQVRGILEGFVRNSPVEKARESSVFWLGRTAGNHPVLSELVQNEQEGEPIRNIAALSIAASRDARSLPMLKGLYSVVKNHTVRRRVLYEILRTSPAEDFRGEGAFWTAQAGNEQRTVDDLIRVYDDEKEKDPMFQNVEINNRVISALYKMNSKQTLTKLMDIARADSSAQLKEQALLWLRQSKDPEVKKFIEAIPK